MPVQRSNLGHLRHFLYACIIIDIANSKLYAFGSMAVSYASGLGFYFVLFI